MRAVVLKMAAAALVFATAAAGWEKWPCGAEGDGENIWCMLWDDGSFSVDGSGAMRDYAGSLLGGSSAPWSDDGGLVGVNNTITKLHIGRGVTSVGNFAFADCRNLTSVTIPGSVVSVGEGAFSGCSALKTVTIMANILVNNQPSVGRDAFFGVDVGNAALLVPAEKIGAYASAGGWEDFGRILAASEAPEATWDIGAVPGTVWAELFRGTGLIISGNGAMRDFNVDSGDLPPWANRENGDAAVGSVHIEDGVTSIGNFAFAGNGDLASMWTPPSLESIGERAFSGCSRLGSIAISKGVTSIGNYAFAECGHLNTVTLQAENPPEVSGSAFDGKSPDFTFYVPEESVDAYRAADVWKDFNIKPILNYTPEAQTWDCGAERGTVTCEFDVMGTLTVSGSGAMRDYEERDTGSSAPWSGLGSDAAGVNVTIFKVVVEDGVTSVGSYAFADCQKLTSVTIPNSVASVGEGAFRGCNGLRHLTSLSVDNPNIADGAFDGVETDSVAVYVPEGVIDDYRKDGGGWTVFGNVQSLENAPASVSSAIRVIPAGGAKTVIAAPAVKVTGKVTAGPNPVSREYGWLNFFRQGKRVKSAGFIIYNANGNVVRKIFIQDLIKEEYEVSKFPIGYWDLTDSKGRPVPEGTYLIKGKITASSGKSERVSFVVGVVK